MEHLFVYLFTNCICSLMKFVFFFLYKSKCKLGNRDKSKPGSRANSATSTAHLFGFLSLWFTFNVLAALPIWLVFFCFQSHLVKNKVQAGSLMFWGCWRNRRSNSCPAECSLGCWQADSPTQLRPGGENRTAHISVQQQGPEQAGGVTF